ncbi:MAG: hypothetical protein CENE_00498 [Candidatus Celerinatantimonas neptuna]|nr:MAG: hypothetical protein CENE_00498 [Candidatus Celerinatantimonas neptuna]
MKIWIIIAIIAFFVGVFINTIQDMCRSTDIYAKRRAKELAQLEAELEKKNKQRTNNHS